MHSLCDLSSRGRRRMAIVSAGSVLLSLIVMTASATTQTRIYSPNYKYIAGFVENPLGLTDTICGIQLPPEADCYGRFEAWVRETTPGGKAICAALMSAKMQQITVTYRADITYPGQCEIVRVET